MFPLWITLGKLILTKNNEPNDEIDIKFGFDYSLGPLFNAVSLFTGIFFQSICPRSKTHVLLTLKTISYYYLLFYFAISLFCLAGSATLNVSTEFTLKN